MRAVLAWREMCTSSTLGACTRMRMCTCTCVRAHARIVCIGGGGGERSRDQEPPTGGVGVRVRGGECDGEEANQRPLLVVERVDVHRAEVRVVPRPVLIPEDLERCKGGVRAARLVTDRPGRLHVAPALWIEQVGPRVHVVPPSKVDERVLAVELTFE